MVSVIGYYFLLYFISMSVNWCKCEAVWFSIPGIMHLLLPMMWLLHMYNVQMLIIILFGYHTYITKTDRIDFQHIISSSQFHSPLLKNSLLYSSKFFTWHIHMLLVYTCTISPNTVYFVYLFSFMYNLLKEFVLAHIVYMYNSFRISCYFTI